MIQDYDTLALYCENTILRFQHLYEEIATLQRSIEKGKKEAAICEERFQRLKKERDYRLNFGRLLNHPVAEEQSE